MNFLLFAFALIMPPVIGFVCVSLCWPSSKTTLTLFVCKLSFAIGMGLGISSLTSFLTLQVAGSTNIFVTFLLEAFLIGFLGSILWYKKIPLLPSLDSRPHSPMSPLSPALAWAFYISLVLAIGIFMLRSLENPHGESDAWTFWNARARLFFRTGDQWFQVFSLGNWAFATYPLQTSMNILRLWSAVDREILMGPICIAFLFTFITAGVLVSAVRLFCSSSQGYLAGILLLGTPFFLKHGAAQYADIPLGFYILMALIIFNLSEQNHLSAKGLWGLAGITVGLAAWTKHEGWLFLISVILARGLTWLILKQKHDVWSEIQSFGGGFLIILAWFFYFWNFLTPSPAKVPPPDFSELFGKVSDLSRYLVIGKAFARQIIEPYSLVYSTPAMIFLIYGLFLGIRRHALKRSGIITTFFVLGFMLAGYFGIYVITTLELTWHLHTSLSRLFLQLWPSIIFLASLVIASPEESMRRQ